jgi:hypothetical protein
MGRLVADTETPASRQGGPLASSGCERPSARAPRARSGRAASVREQLGASAMSPARRPARSRCDSFPCSRPERSCDAPSCQRPIAAASSPGSSSPSHRTSAPCGACPRTPSARRSRREVPVRCRCSRAEPAGVHAPPRGARRQFSRSRGRCACARPLKLRCGCRRRLSAAVRRASGRDRSRRRQRPCRAPGR